MEAHPEKEKPASVDMKPEAAEQQEEVPVEDATVMPVVEPEEETTSITRKETMACQEMEERLEEEEPTPVDRKPSAVSPSAPKPLYPSELLTELHAFLVFLCLPYSPIFLVSSIL
jgi:hypothetical protein